MEKVPTILSGFLKGLFYYLVKEGIAPEIIEEKTKILRTDLENNETRFPLSDYVLLWKVAEELTNDPTIGLKLGSDPNWKNASIALHASLQCSTMKDSVKSFIKFSKLLNEAEEITLSEEEKIVSWSIISLFPEYYLTSHIERMLTSCVTMFIVRDLSDFILEVHFKHSKPSYVEVYDQFFPCKVLFNQPENSVVFDKKLLDIRLLDASPYVREVLRKHAEQLLQKLDRFSSIKVEVQKLMVRFLPKGIVDMEMIAAKINMSKPTLYRKLKDEGTSFQELLNRVRIQLMDHYFLEQKLSISEISYLLGYSEASAFHRAFKQWKRTTPQKYRNTLLKNL